MIIIKLQGRLGNQMFEYAFAKKMYHMGKKVKLDCELLKCAGDYYELAVFPNIDIGENRTIKVATMEEILSLGDFDKSFGQKVRRKILGCKRTYIKEKRLGYDESILQTEKGYLQGYWQSEQYFKDIEQEIRDDFMFPDLKIQKDSEIKNMIEQSNAVSIHIRRGDYLEQKISNIYGNICTNEYYEKSIEYFNKRFQNIIFFVFSDDYEWCKKRYQNNKNFYVVKSSGAYVDMQLMSSCKHHIIANSSFSWWAAWLNSSSDKIVLAPSVWVHGEENFDIWCEGWRKIV